MNGFKLDKIEMKRKSWLPLLHQKFYFIATNTVFIGEKLDPVSRSGMLKEKKPIFKGKISTWSTMCTVNVRSTSCIENNNK